MGGCDLLRQLIKVGGVFAVGDFEFLRRMQRVERRAFLDGELVKRQVVGGIADCLFQLRRPGFRCLAGTGINQVEGKPREDFAGEPDRMQGLVHIVQPAEELQVAVVQRLHAQRNAVDARRAIAAKTLGLDG